MPETGTVKFATIPITKPKIAKTRDSAMIYACLILFCCFHVTGFTMNNIVSFTARSKNGSYEQIIKITKALENNNNLLELNLNNLDFGDAGAVILAKLLKKNKTLKILRIQSNKISDYGIKKIIDALRSNSSLMVLDLQHNYITPDSIINFVDLMSSNTTLIQIRIHNGGMGQIYRKSKGSDDFVVEYELNIKCMAVASGLVGSAGSFICDGNDGYEYSGSFLSVGLSAYVNIFFPMSEFHITIKSPQLLEDRTTWKGSTIGLGIGYLMLTRGLLKDENNAQMHFYHLNALAAGIDLAKVILKLKRGDKTRHQPAFLNPIHKTVKLSSISREN